MYPVVAIPLRTARERRTLTQQQLAQLSGVRQSHISALELGKKSDLFLSTAIKLARALRMNILQVDFTASVSE